jgi:AraC-like DNA-binding protein
MTPHEVIRRRRLQEVAARLRTGSGEDLARVAAETGYADHAHLTRDFRDSVRQTPRDFRRAR